MSDELEKRLRVYCAVYQATYQDVAAVIGVSVKTLERMRKGRVPFTMRQGFIMSELLDMSLIDLYDILPDCNHADI